MYDVLIVDNEPVILEGLSNLINWEMKNCRIYSTALNGSEALEKLRYHQYDIVITDIRMPEMDGLQLCEKIREEDMPSQLIILTGFPEFQYAQKAIRFDVADFILKPTTEEALITALGKAIEKLNRNNEPEDNKKSQELQQQIVLNEIIYGRNHSYLYYLNRLNDASIVLMDYYVVSMRIPLMEDDRDNVERMQNLRTCIRTHRGDNTVYIVSKCDNECYCVASAINSEILMGMCDEIIDEIDKQYDFLLSIGVSSNKHDPLQLGKAAGEADDARRFAKYDIQEPFIWYDMLPKVSDDTKKELYQKLKLTEASIENRSQEMFQNNLDDIFNFMTEHTVPFSTVMQTAQLLRNFGVQILINHNLLDKQDSFYDDKINIDTTERLKEYLEDFFDEILQRLNFTEGSDDKVIEQIRQYIDSNYKSNLSLDALAEKAHLSPTYFSRLFKRKMNANLSAYILSVRIEKAKVLLKSTDMMVYEVAEEIGIGDPVYFSKIFKKATGKKPKDFRTV